MALGESLQAGQADNGESLHPGPLARRVQRIIGQCTEGAGQALKLGHLEKGEAKHCLRNQGQSRSVCLVYGTRLAELYL